MLRVLKFMLPAFCGLALLACAQEGADDATDETADTTAMAEGISLADLAGTWDMVTTNTDPGDTVVNRYQIVIDETSWTLIFPDRDPVPVTFVIDGDSAMTESAPFESVRRPGTMVVTNTVFRLEGDRLVGDVVGHFQTTEADSVVQLRTEGTRAP
jgi:hypothetical protein